MEQALHQWGRLDILINNAGVARGGMIYNARQDDWDALLAMNLTGHFTVTRPASEIFRRQRSGRIIATSSHAGLGFRGNAAYSASREGILGFTRTVARDMAPFGVTVNCIRPAAATRLTADGMLPAGYAPRRWPAWPSGSATDAAAGVTGQDIGVTGDLISVHSRPRPGGNGLPPGRLGPGVAGRGVPRGVQSLRGRPGVICADAGRARDRPAKRMGLTGPPDDFALGLAGRAALVTGSSAGIGKAVALEFARQGADVAICGRRPDALHATAAEIEREGVRVVPVQVDVSTRAGCEELVTTAAAELGRLDILINNVGNSRFGGLLEFPDGYIDALDGKLLAYVRCTRLAAPHIAQQGGGSIVNITGATQHGMTGHSAGSIANAGARIFSKICALEFADLKIRVNSIAPGAIRTGRILSGVQAAADRDGVDPAEYLAARAAGSSPRTPLAA